MIEKWLESELHQSLNVDTKVVTLRNELHQSRFGRPPMNWFEPNSLQLIVADLNEIAADAYHHRIRPASKKGGGGAYNAAKGGFAY